MTKGQRVSATRSAFSLMIAWRIRAACARVGGVLDGIQTATGFLA
jgi:hypothetical protein